MATKVFRRFNPERTLEIPSRKGDSTIIITRTPYRISFLGGGTDYPSWYREHDGSVLSATIDKYCYIAATPYHAIFPQRYKVYWKIVELVERISDIEHPVVREGLQFLGYKGSLKLYYHGDLPAQSGLGSSSSFTVGFVKAMAALMGEALGKEDLAKRAIHIERVLLGEHGGDQDQIEVAYGGFNQINFHKDSFKVNPVTLPSAFSKHLLLFYIGRDSERFSSDYAKNWIENIPHKTTELMSLRNLVEQGIRCLNQDMDEFGCILDEAWFLKRSLAEGISNEKVDGVYAAAKKAGALGGKLLGAGGEGFMLFYVPLRKKAHVLEALSSFTHVPFKFEKDGCKHFKIS